MSEQKQARVLLVDDNAVIRGVLRGLIRHDESIDVVGEASSGELALEQIEALKPDLVCLDVLMPGMNGLTVLSVIRIKHPDTRVIVVSGESTANVVSRALKLGASGFVVKPFNAQKVLRAIHNALESPIPPLDPAAFEEMAAQKAVSKTDPEKIDARDE